jgi:hypothetical protein
MSETGTGSEAISSAKEMATAAGRAAKEDMTTIADYAGRRTKEQLEHQKQAAVETLGEFANAIRHAGDELAQHDRTLAGRLVKQTADGLEQFSRSMADKRPEELLDAVRDFGRRNPVVFIAGSVLAGVALARFLRSSNTSKSRSATIHEDQEEREPYRPDRGQGFSDVRSGGVVEQAPIGPGQ